MCAEQQTNDFDARASRLLKRADEHQQIIERAVRAADAILLEAAGKSREDLNWLTARIAREFIDKALLSLESAIAKKELGI
jgi:hypothetical protein